MSTQKGQQQKRVRTSVNLLGVTYAKNLETLDLSHRGLPIVPEKLAEFTNLLDVRLNNNVLTDIPDLFGIKLDEDGDYITSIAHLNLSYNKLTTLPSSFGSIFSIRELNLSHNLFADLPFQEDDLPHVEVLNLSFNQLSSFTYEGSDLINLNISQNQLTSLPEDFGDYYSYPLYDKKGNTYGIKSNLKILNMNGNQLTELPESFNKLIGLSHLNVSYNQLTYLPEMFENLVNLTELDLSHNQLSFLLDEIEMLKGLTRLNLSHNQFHDLPFFSAVDLKELDLSHNLFKTLPSSVSALFKLLSLNLDGNPFRTLPESFGLLKSLTTLSLRGLPKSFIFPMSFRRLTALVTLLVDDNDYIAPSSAVYKFIASLSLTKFKLRIRINKKNPEYTDYFSRATHFAKEIQQEAFTHQMLQRQSKTQQASVAFYRKFFPTDGSFPTDFKMPVDFENPFRYFQFYYKEKPLACSFPYVDDSIRIRVLKNDFENYQKCFEQIVSLLPYEYTIKLFQINQQGLERDEAVMDAGAVKRQFFYHAGLYVKEQMYFNEELNVYTFKYGTSVKFIADVGYLILVSVLAGITIDVRFSAGILYYFLCILHGQSPLGSSKGDYMGRLMYLADLDDSQAIEMLISHIKFERYAGYLQGQQPDESFKNVQQQHDVSYKVLPSILAYCRSLERKVFVHTEGSISKDEIEEYIRIDIFTAMETGMNRGKKYFTLNIPMKLTAIQCYRDFLMASLTAEVMLKLPIYYGGSKSETTIIQNYYTQFIREYPELWRPFLLFVTATVQPSLGIKITILPPNDARLPSTHSCFKEIQIPLYSSYDIFVKQVTLALNDKTFGFG